MPIKLRRVRNRYTGSATPPDSDQYWETTTALTAKKIIAELRRVGCHTTDITDALYEADPFWQNRLNEAETSAD